MIRFLSQLLMCVFVALAASVERPKPKAKSGSLLPERTYCGLQHTDDYIRTDNSIAIDEYPWSAILLCEEQGAYRPKCSGSLISSRYVLTLADCVIKPAPDNVVAVRLGEYNVKNQTDCIGDDPNSNLYECSEPPQDFSVEKIIVHPAFSGRYQDTAHNLALLRLNKSVSYSDYIRPICLPTPGTRFATIGDTLTISGWGLSKTGGGPTELKKKILTELLSTEDCLKVNSAYAQFVTPNDFCTRDFDDGADVSCQGDGGAPIMFSYRNQWHQEGILSFAMGCGSGLPNVHTKVVNYLKWIEASMES